MSERRRRKQAKLKGVRHKPQEIYRVIWAGKKNKYMSDSEGESRSLLRDKLGKMFTLRIHYANQGIFSALPSRNHQVVNSNHAGDYVIVALQPPQAKLCLLPRGFKGCKFSFCKKK